MFVGINRARNRANCGGGREGAARRHTRATDGGRKRAADASAQSMLALRTGAPRALAAVQAAAAGAPAVRALAPLRPRAAAPPVAALWPPASRGRSGGDRGRSWVTLLAQQHAGRGQGRRGPAPRDAAAGWRCWATLPVLQGGAPAARTRGPSDARAVHYRSGHRFREYQGWDGGGPAPSIFGLLVRPVLFSGAVVVGSLGLAAIYKDEQRRKQGWVWPGQQRRQLAGVDFMGWRFSVSELVCGSLVAVNGAVFLCWTLSLRGAPSLEVASPWLRRYFLHHAFSGRALPLLGSAFSHTTFPHFLFNMLALWSFGPSLVRDLGPENFFACYLSAAALTSLGGTLVKLATRCTLPSVGASGAVLWMAATTAFRSAAWRILSPRVAPLQGWGTSVLLLVMLPLLPHPPLQISGRAIRDNLLAIRDNTSVSDDAGHRLSGLCRTHSWVLL